MERTALDIEALVVVVRIAAKTLCIFCRVLERTVTSVVVGEHHVGNDVVLITELILVVSTKTLVECDGTVVVGTVIPVELELPTDLLCLLMARSEEALNLLHCCCIGAELRVYTNAVDAVILEDLNEALYVFVCAVRVLLCQLAEGLAPTACCVHVNICRPRNRSNATYRYTILVSNVRQTASYAEPRCCPVTVDAEV